MVVGLCTDGTYHAPRSSQTLDDDIITMKEAALLFGVSEQTLRCWDEAGKFKVRRHPINGDRVCEEYKVPAMGKKILGKPA
jgi:hypothetical protein